MCSMLLTEVVKTLSEAVVMRSAISCEGSIVGPYDSDDRNVNRRENVLRCERTRIYAKSRFELLIFGTDKVTMNAVQPDSD